MTSGRGRCGRSSHLIELNDCAPRGERIKSLDMDVGQPRAAVWGIWALVAAFAALQAATWAGAGGIPGRPAVIAEVIAGWGIVLVLAIMSTRRIGGLARTVTETEDAH